jgi:hypothetical protein
MRTVKSNTVSSDSQLKFNQLFHSLSIRSDYQYIQVILQVLSFCGNKVPFTVFTFFLRDVKLLKKLATKLYITSGHTTKRLIYSYVEIAYGRHIFKR